MTKNESIKLAKKWISQHINEDEFFMTSISVGKTNWGKSADEFDSNRYLIAFPNKDQETTEDILGNDIYDYEEIIANDLNETTCASSISMVSKF